MSKIKRTHRDQSRLDQKYIARIKKSLCYAKPSKNDSLSVPVTELAAELFSEPHYGKSLNRLHCDDAASISRHASVSSCSLVIAVLYLERLRKTCPEYLEKTASTDLFLVSLMISSKFLYDDGETQEVIVDKWAEAGGISVKELVRLEREFLKAIDWNVYVSDQVFWNKLNELETSVAKRQGLARGFFTYTEVKSLLMVLRLQPLIHCFISASVILIASYTATVFLLYNSVNLIKNSHDIELQKRLTNIGNNQQFFNSANTERVDRFQTENIINLDEFLLLNDSSEVMENDSETSKNWLVSSLISISETTHCFKFIMGLFNYDVFLRDEIVKFENDIPKSTMLRMGEDDLHCKYVTYSQCSQLVI